VQAARSDDEALAAALRGGHNETAAALLDAGVHPDAWGSDECTPIFAAVEAGNVAGVELMVSRGADLGVTDHEGYTALDRALETGHCAVVERLLDAGADTGVGDTESLFCACAGGGSEACLSSVLEALPRRLGRALTPSELAEGLCYAVSYGTEAMVRVLLAAGAPPNGDGGFHPLYNATERYNVQPAMARVLMEAGADPEASGLDAEVSALVWMVAGRADRVREALARLPPGAEPRRFENDCIVLAAVSGNRECVELAWERGAFRYEDGFCRVIGRLGIMGRIDAVRLVLSVAAELHQSLPLGMMVSYCTWGRARLDVVTALIDAGCRVNTLSDILWTGLSPAAAAAQWGAAVEPLELLLSRGARLDGSVELVPQSWLAGVVDTVANVFGARLWWRTIRLGPTVLEAAVTSKEATAAKIECVLRHMPPHLRPAQPPAGWHNLRHGDAIRALVSAYPTLPHARLASGADRGCTGLHCAALVACASAVEGWLSVGADPLRMDKEGMRPRDIVGGAAQYDMGGWAMRMRACGALLLRAEGWARRRVAVVAACVA